jgi:hypothetical protein
VSSWDVVAATTVRFAPHERKTRATARRARSARRERPECNVAGQLRIVAARESDEAELIASPNTAITTRASTSASVRIVPDCGRESIMASRNQVVTLKLAATRTRRTYAKVAYLLRDRLVSFARVERQANHPR